MLGKLVSKNIVSQENV